MNIHPGNRPYQTPYYLVIYIYYIILYYIIYRLYYIIYRLTSKNLVFSLVIV